MHHWSPDLLNRHCRAAIAATLVLLLWSAPAAAVQVIVEERFELNEQTFNQWLFNARQGSFDSESELTLTLEAVDRVCGLSPPQKEKLRLAGRGDFARFEQRVDELRTKFVGKKYGQNEIGEIFQKVQPLGAAYQAGLLGESSLFAKVLAQSLSREQAEEYERLEAQRRQKRYAAKVRLFVAAMERSCPLSDKQRRALVELLIAETKLPKRFGQYDCYVVMCQAGKIPDEKYGQILDEAQMRQLQQMLQHAQGIAQFLRQQKILADD
jgi:hypothetical protein